MTYRGQTGFKEARRRSPIPRISGAVKESNGALSAASALVVDTARKMKD
jgi:hypothetical protein